MSSDETLGRDSSSREYSTSRSSDVDEWKEAERNDERAFERAGRNFELIKAMRLSDFSSLRQALNPTSELLNPSRKFDYINQKLNKLGSILKQIRDPMKYQRLHEVIAILEDCEFGRSLPSGEINEAVFLEVFHQVQELLRHILSVKVGFSEYRCNSKLQYALYLLLGLCAKLTSPEEKNPLILLFRRFSDIIVIITLEFQADLFTREGGWFDFRTSFYDLCSMFSEEIVRKELGDVNQFKFSYFVYWYLDIHNLKLLSDYIDTHFQFPAEDPREDSMCFAFLALLARNSVVPRLSPYLTAILTENRSQLRYFMNGYVEDTGRFCNDFLHSISAKFSDKSTVVHLWSFAESLVAEIRPYCNFLTQLVSLATQPGSYSIFQSIQLAQFVVNVYAELAELNFPCFNETSPYLLIPLTVIPKNTEDYHIYEERLGMDMKAEVLAGKKLVLKMKEVQEKLLFCIDEEGLIIEIFRPEFYVSLLTFLFLTKQHFENLERVMPFDLRLLMRHDIFFYESFHGSDIGLTTTDALKLILIEENLYDVTALSPSPFSVSVPFRSGPLQNIEWNVPNFALLIGKTGVGKSNVVRYLDSHYQSTIFIEGGRLELIDTAFADAKGKLTELLDEPTLGPSEMDMLYYIYMFSAFPNQPMIQDNSAYSFPILALLCIEERNANGHNSIAEKLNNYCVKYGLGFEFECVHGHGQFALVFRKGSLRLGFADLSSGEKTMFVLISCVVCNQIVTEKIGNNMNPRLLLFDEVDIHFHPDYTKSFFRILEDFFSENSYIVMTTHNPATIALSPPRASVWNVDRDAASLDTRMSLVSSRRLAVSLLSSHQLSYSEDQNLVLLEDATDAKVFSIVYQKFVSSGSVSQSRKLVFMSSGANLKGIDKIAGDLATALGTATTILASEQSRMTPENYDALLEQLTNLQSVTKSLKGMVTHGTGCQQIRQKTDSMKYEGRYNDRGLMSMEKRGGKGADNLDEIVDRQYNTDVDKKVFVTNYHSMENYLLFPIVLANALGRTVHHFRNDESYKDVYSFICHWWETWEKDVGDSEETRILTQRVCNYIIACIDAGTLLNPYEFEEPQNLDYSETLVNGWKIEVRKDLLFSRGHHLLTRIFNNLFQGINPKRNETHLVQQLLTSLERIPAGFIPLNLLQTIENLRHSDELNLDLTANQIVGHLRLFPLTDGRYVIPRSVTSESNFRNFCRYFPNEMEFYVQEHDYVIVPTPDVESTLARYVANDLLFADIKEKGADMRDRASELKAQASVKPVSAKSLLKQFKSNVVVYSVNPKRTPKKTKITGAPDVKSTSEESPNMITPRSEESGEGRTTQSSSTTGRKKNYLRSESAPVRVFSPYDAPSDDPGILSTISNSLETGTVSESSSETK